MLLWNQKGAVNMKKLKISLLVSVVVSIILEALPYGAVCNFATPEKTLRTLFSYFDLTPFGYANFGPFLTACLSCVILLLSVLMFVSDKPVINKAATIISAVTIVTSLMPLMFDVSYFSIIGGILSVLMIIQFVIIMIIKKRENNEA